MVVAVTRFGTADAMEEGAFQWSETALMLNPLLGHSRPVNLLSLEPGKKSAKVLCQGTSGLQVVWPFDSLNESMFESFAEQVSWLVDGAEGSSEHFRSIPESDPSGSWQTKEQ